MDLNSLLAGYDHDQATKGPRLLCVRDAKKPTITVWVRYDYQGSRIDLSTQTFTPTEFFDFVNAQFRTPVTTPEAQRDVLRMVVEVLHTGKFPGVAEAAGWNYEQVLTHSLSLFSETSTASEKVAA